MSSLKPLFVFSFVGFSDFLILLPMSSQIFYPSTNLFPQQPQLLHQMVLQFFLMADKYEDIFSQSELSRLLIVPYGSYFDTGLIQAAAYRYRLKSIQPKKVYILSFAKLPSNVSVLASSYESMHTFFGELKVDQDGYNALKNIHTDNALFAKHADPIVCQLPFIRSYYPVESIVPVIVNTEATIDWTTLWKNIVSDDKDVGYIFCANSMVPQITKAEEAYSNLVGENSISSLLLQKTA